MPRRWPTPTRTPTTSWAGSCTGAYSTRSDSTRRARCFRWRRAPSSLCCGGKARERVADRRRDRCGLSRRALDEHVHERPERAEDLPVEDPDRIPDAAVPELLHPQPGVEHVRECDRVLVGALRIDADTDHRASLDVEPALLDEEAVDDGVEVRVVDDVVDVPVDVVVVPARLDLEQVGENFRRQLSAAVHFSPPPQSNAFAATVMTSGVTDSLS